MFKKAIILCLFLITVTSACGNQPAFKSKRSEVISLETENKYEVIDKSTEKASQFLLNITNCNEINLNPVTEWVNQCVDETGYYEYIHADPDSWDIFIYVPEAQGLFGDISNKDVNIEIIDGVLKIYVDTNNIKTSDRRAADSIIHFSASMRDNWPNDSELYVNDKKILKISPVSVTEVESDNPIGSMPIRPDVDETDAFIAPIGNDVINNGSSVVQYGDSVYFYALTDTPDKMGSTWSICVMKENGDVKYKLVDVEYPSRLYFAGHYLLASELWEDKSYRINVETGETNNFINGRIQTIDYEAQLLFYSVDKFNELEESGLYQTDLTGENAKKLCSDDYRFLAKEGQLLYLEGPHAENSGDVVLCVIDIDSGEIKILASVPAVENMEDGNAEYESIVDFGICGDWIIMSVGNYQGTGHFYYGGLVKLKKDGTALERLGSSGIDKFFVIDDRIYYNDWNNRNLGDGEDDSGCYRMHSNSTVDEFLGKEVQWLFSTSQRNLFYRYFSGKYIDIEQNSPINDLRMCNTDISNVITLFKGSTAPLFEDSNYIDYSRIENVGEYIYFNVDIHGYDSEKDNWRGHSDYSAYFRTKKDGSELTLIYKDIKARCPYLEK